MRRRTVGRIFAAGGLSTAIVFAAAISQTPFDGSQDFFRLLDLGQFMQAAALFHYPEGDDEQRHATDVQDLIDFLAGLVATAGSLSVRTPRKLDEETMTVGMGGGNIAYWSSHPEFDRAISVDYVVQTPRVGALGFTLNWIDVRGLWELRSVMCSVLASRADARTVIEEIAKPFLSKMAQRRSLGT